MQITNNNIPVLNLRTIYSYNHSVKLNVNYVVNY
jgi:hypothetical protein